GGGLRMPGRAGRVARRSRPLNRRRQTARQVRDAALEFTRLAWSSIDCHDACAGLQPEQIAEESVVTRVTEIPERLHARAADTAHCSRRLCLQLNRLLRGRAADAVGLPGLSTPQAGLVDGG